jgi:SAM-dependent methyltransferase
MSKYNIGAGLFRKKGWINIDNPSRWYEKIIDTDCIPYDLLELKPLPIESETADIVYSSHTIEHVTNEAVENMVKESHRILKPGGVLRITAPNINLDGIAYMKNDIEHFNIFSAKIGLMTKSPLRAASIEQKFLWHFAANVSILHTDGAATRITDDEFKKMFMVNPINDMLNYCVSLVDMKKQRQYPGNHCNWWNIKKLYKIVQNAGFKSIYSSKKGESIIEELNGKKFDSTIPEVSFFLEAIK